MRPAPRKSCGMSGSCRSDRLRSSPLGGAWQFPHRRHAGAARTTSKMSPVRFAGSELEVRDEPRDLRVLLVAHAALRTRCVLLLASDQCRDALCPQPAKVGDAPRRPGGKRCPPAMGLHHHGPVDASHATISTPFHRYPHVVSRRSGAQTVDGGNEAELSHPQYDIDRALSRLPHLVGARGQTASRLADEYG